MRLEKLLKTFLVLSAAAISFETAHAQNAAVIHKNDGSIIRVPVEEIDSIVYEYPSANDYEAIDLGLSVKWSPVNLDLDEESLAASSPEDCGGLYGWGDPTGLHHEQNYGPTRDYYLDDLNKFLEIYGGAGVEEISGTERDIARMKWGGAWRIPTKDEWQELKSECTLTRTSRNGTEGIEAVGPNGNSIFFPYGGWRIADVVKLYNEVAYYWTSTAVPGDATSCYCIGMGTTECYLMYTQRYCGHSIRPVRE